MSDQIILVGATDNDGTGDPLRTAFIKTNSNFAEVYANGSVALSIARAGTIAAAQAGSLAYSALVTAWVGTQSSVTANAALNAAWSGTAGANQAFQIAVAGTNAAGQAISQVQTEAIARVFGDGTILAQAKNYTDSVSGTNASGVVITTATTFYVRTDGTDSNNGASNTPSGAFKTIQGGLDKLCQKTISATVTLQVNDGTYNESVVLPLWQGRGAVIVLGNQSAPENVVVNTSVGSGFCFNADTPSRTYIRYLKTHGVNGSFEASRGGVLVVTGIVSDACAVAHFVALNNGHIEILGVNKITGGATQCLQSGLSKGLIVTDGATFYMSAAQSYVNAFAVASDLSVIHASSMTFSAGSNVTAARYSSGGLSIIDTAGGGATYFPGTSGGVTGNGGLYL